MLNRSTKLPSSSVTGSTLIESLVTILVLGILTAIAAPNIRFGVNPLRDTSDRLAGNLKMLRAKAISQTSAYRMRAIPQGSGFVITHERARLCSDAPGDWRTDAAFASEDAAFDAPVTLATVTLNGTSASVNNWSVCYSSRGLASQNVVFTLQDDQSRQKRVTVFPGGGVDVQAVP